MAISETLITENRLDFVNFDMYSPVNNYRPDEIGGGVSLYVHEILNYKQRTDFFFSYQFY